MQNDINQNERNNILKSVEDLITQKVNPYYISEIEKAVKTSLNPLISQNEVNIYLNYLIIFIF